MATRDEWAKRVKRWEASGLDAAAFARREGLVAKRLVWWRWKLRSTPGAPTPEPRFVPVRLVDAASRPTPPEGSIEIALPNGRIVRVAPGFDPDTLAQVLAVAAGGDAC